MDHRRIILGATRKGAILRIIGIAAFLSILGALLLRSPMRLSYAASSASSTDWLTYMGGNARTGYNSAETTLNSTSARKLKLHWQVHAGGPVSSQAMVTNNAIYWGSWDGYEHATDLNGHELWHTFLGVAAPAGCFPPKAGVASPATVSTVSINGQQRQVVFVGGGDAHFYALDASNGQVIWSTMLGQPPDNMIWGGSAFYNGSIYVGISSYGDCPLTPGKLFQIDAATGSVQHSFATVPSKCDGAGIWMSPTIDAAANTIYVTTGTIDVCKPYENLAYGILQLNASDLSLTHSWQVPSEDQISDGDFGSTPTLFTATINGSTHQLLGAVNKNGIYYALDRANISAGYVWKVRLSTQADNAKSSISSSAWDGKTLYAADSHTIIGGRDCMGSVRALDPSSGKILWEHCMPGKIQGSVMAVPGLVAVGSGEFIIVLDATTGKQIFAYRDGSAASSLFWGTPTICNGMLYMGNRDGWFYAFGL